MLHHQSLWHIGLQKVYNDLSSINYQQKSVGFIQYFTRHSIHLNSDEGIEVLEHVFALEIQTMTFIDVLLPFL